MTLETKNTQKIYFENLDALRAIAALSVVGFHSVNSFQFTENKFTEFFASLVSFNGQGGPYGVAFFFILSGFLITYLIFQEIANISRLNVWYFYMRRLLRIWPLYYLTLLVGFVLYPLTMAYFGNGYEESASASMYIFFLGNFDIILNQEAPSVGILGIHWSLSVEEQFYLFWPLIFFFVKKPKSILFVFCCLFIASEVFYWCNSNTYVQYYHLISNLRFLVFGAIIAYFAFFKLDHLRRIVDFGGATFKFSLYVICLLLIFFTKSLNAIVEIQVILHFIPIFFFSYIIAEQSFSSKKIVTLGRFRILTVIGKISYGVYLLHMIVIYGILNFFGESDPYFLKLICTFILSVCLSHIVYHLYEAPFLKLKKRFNE